MKMFMAVFHTVACLPYQIDHARFKTSHHKSLREPLFFLHTVTTTEILKSEVKQF